MRKGRMQRGPAQGKYRGASMKHKRGGPGGGFRGREGEGMGMGMHMGPPGMWWKNPMVVQKLALTADQTKRMDDIFQKSRLELIDLRAKLETQNALLEPLMSANPVDTAKAMAQIDKVAQARADLEKSDARMLLGIRGVLTPDQWTKLSAPRGPGEYGQPGGPGPGGPGGQAGAAPNAGPGGPGRGRGYRGGGPAQSASELVDPIDLP
jgi:Spy/CpxP family protein refolding chaperone